jgi:adenylate cyclase
MQPMQRIFFSITIAAAVVALVGFGYVHQVAHILQESITDRLFLVREAPRSVVIVAIDDESVASIGQWPWPRAVFADVLEKLDSAAAIAFDVSFSESSRFGVADDMLFADALRKQGNAVVLPVRVDERGNVAGAPLPILLAEATQSGDITLPVDHDGVARRFTALQDGRESLGFIVAKRLQTEIPAHERATNRIFYYGPAKTILTLPFVDVLEGRIPDEVFAGKAVLIGATAPDLHDTLETPFGPLPGVEIHGTIVAALAEGDAIKETPQILGLLMIAFVGAFTAACILLLKRFRTIALCLALEAVGILGVAALLFGLGIIIPHVYLMASFLGTAGALILFQYVAESREKRFIRESFQHYLMPEVVDELLRDPRKLALGGEKRTVTIFFSDIRGFTSISEKLSPEALVELMNEYLSDMTDCILENRGLVDKYIGDAIMAFWGAPLPNTTQIEDAARGARAMHERLQALNRGWQARGIPRVAIGMGISTGDVIVGNMGSRNRFNYTLMGDEVNFASRLEGLTKSYGVSCIVGEHTARELEKLGTWTVRELDLVTVKGKKEPRRIYELTLDPPDANRREVYRHFAEGLAYYRQGIWERAIREFEAAIAIVDDGPSRVFSERSRMFKKNPPPNWQGVYEFTTK